MRAMFTMMNNARLSVGLEGLAISERAYQQALAYSNERRQGRAPGAPVGEASLIVDHPDVRRMLMTQRAWIDAMRCLVYTNAAVLDRDVAARAAGDSDEAQRWQERADLLTAREELNATLKQISQSLEFRANVNYIAGIETAKFTAAETTPINARSLPTFSVCRSAMINVTPKAADSENPARSPVTV